LTTRQVSRRAPAEEIPRQFLARRAQRSQRRHSKALSRAESAELAEETFPGNISRRERRARREDILRQYFAQRAQSSQRRHSQAIFRAESAEPAEKTFQAIFRAESAEVAEKTFEGTFSRGERRARRGDIPRQSLAGRAQSSQRRGDIPRQSPARRAQSPQNRRHLALRPQPECVPSQTRVRNAYRSQRALSRLAWRHFLPINELTAIAVSA
jgi:hypothetical protein